MNVDIAPDEVAARVSSSSIPVVADIDIDEAVRAGKKRLMRQGLAVAGAVGCVALVAGAVFILSPVTHDNQARQDRASATASVGATNSMLTAEQLGGRWLALSIDGNDVSSWRDVSGLPANMIIGADGSPDQWQVNRACGPLVQGDFILGQDGAFAMPAPAQLWMQPCPMLRTATPDLVGAISRTAFVTVDQPSNSPSRTMSFFDGNRKPVARWREDVAIKGSTSVCKKALGKDATADGTFTTIRRILRQSLPATKNPGDVFRGVSGGDIAIYCHGSAATPSVRYAVTINGQMVELRQGS
jgi:hypothetical protein